MARISEYNYELCLEICDLIADGKHIVDVLNSNDTYPSWSTFRRWKRDNYELQTLYTRSIQDKAEMLIFEINQTMQDVKQGKLDASQGRLIIDTYKWLASKFYPKMFGDKTDITSGGEKIQNMPQEVKITIVTNEDAGDDSI